MAEQKQPSTVVVVTGADDLKKLLGSAAPSPDKPADPVTEKLSTTEHAAEIGGRTITYRAVAGTLPVRLENPDLPKGKMFYVAYTRTDAGDVDRRPITFCFNGGPGSSSIWLHMGLLGPYRVRLDVGQIPAPGAIAAPNLHSLLDVTDLVFVDPVATGFSKADQGKGAEYHGVAADTQSVGEFIRRYVTRHGRWGSPKYLAGESYGTTRAAALARHLQERHGLYLNGIVLLSLALKFQTLKFDPGNDLPYVLYVQGYAAVAAYHRKVIPDDLDGFLARAGQWAYDQYLPALARGSSLPDADRQRIAGELAGFTGLSREYVLRCNLRVDLLRFCRELLRDENQTVGRLDARFTGRGRDQAGEMLEVDPAMSALSGAYTSAFHHHLRGRLGYEEDDVYEVLNLEANQAWAWDQQNQYVDLTEELRHALVENPHLRVFVASGQYDLATPPFASDYTLHQLALAPERQAAITHRKYPAGHMMYVHEPSIEALRRDLVAFYAG